MKNSQRFFYGRVAEHFETLDNPYDIARRLEIVFAELLAGDSLANKRVLDLGCGYGAFSQIIARQGGMLVSCDIVTRLVQRTMDKTGHAGATMDACQLAFCDSAFDMVVTSEMIEHTESPRQAFVEIARVLSPEGTLILTTPNKTWQWLVRLASHLGMRPFQGMENFVTWQELEMWCAEFNFHLVRHIGFHPFPFQFKFLWNLSRLVDQRFSTGAWATRMINQAILARRQPSDYQQ